MKLSHILILLCCTLAVISCDYESYEEEITLANLETGNPYVRILTGDGAESIDVVVSEDEPGVIPVSLQYPFISGGDVTVQYTLGGTAEFGEIYTIEDASASGGTAVIPFENAAADDVSPPNVAINIELFVDTLENGPQTIVLGLESATSEEGTAVDIGQGTLRRGITINLVND